MSGRVLCVGETHVELVGRGDAFAPEVGGGAARVALSAARLGASVALVGCVGDDHWGRWLRVRLAAAGVELSGFELRGDVQTPLAILSSRYGGFIEGPGLQGLAGASALFISLSGPEERELVQRARARALEHDLPVVFAPGLVLERWRSQADAAASANACVPSALLVRVTAAEAAVLTGEDDPERAAQALVKAGARLVVLTLGAEGAILRGELRSEVFEAVATEDVFTGVLLARLAMSNFYPPVVAAALTEACRA
jgi:sugar/nucleoside kinase (ribokinase family)